MASSVYGSHHIYQLPFIILSQVSVSGPSCTPSLHCQQLQTPCFLRLAVNAMVCGTLLEESLFHYALNLCLPSLRQAWERHLRIQWSWPSLAGLRHQPTHLCYGHQSTMWLLQCGVCRRSAQRPTGPPSWGKGRTNQAETGLYNVGLGPLPHLQPGHQHPGYEQDDWNHCWSRGYKGCQT